MSNAATCFINISLVTTVSVFHTVNVSLTSTWSESIRQDIHACYMTHVNSQNDVRSIQRSAYYDEGHKDTWWSCSCLLDVCVSVKSAANILQMVNMFFILGFSCWSSSTRTPVSVHSVFCTQKINLNHTSHLLKNPRITSLLYTSPRLSRLMKNLLVLRHCCIRHCFTSFRLWHIFLTNPRIYVPHEYFSIFPASQVPQCCLFWITRLGCFAGSPYTIDSDKGTVRSFVTACSSYTKLYSSFRRSYFTLAITRPELYLPQHLHKCGSITYWLYCVNLCHKEDNKTLSLHVLQFRHVNVVDIINNWLHITAELN